SRERGGRASLRAPPGRAGPARRGRGGAQRAPRGRRGPPARARPLGRGAPPERQLEPRGGELRARLRRRPGPGGAVSLHRLPARGRDLERLLRGVQALGNARGGGGAGALTQLRPRSMVARMAHLELIELYPSPWSARLRWALEWKRVPYARRAYQPLAGEEELRRATGLSTVPVLLADGEVVGDSDAALAWLEEHHPSPALLPEDPRLRAQVRAWEIAAPETLAPAGRRATTRRGKGARMPPLAVH